MIQNNDNISSLLILGDCLNSQGEISTDKLFTGQRLDDTGLYLLWSQVPSSRGNVVDSWYG